MLFYVRNIYKARYFWLHLTLADLRAKYRRSMLGILWAILQPLGLAALMGAVMSAIFKISIIEYLPYLFSGLVIWEFITTSAIAGCNSFINAECYIKQYTHPLAIYPLRHVLASLMTLILALVGLIGWIGINTPTHLEFIPFVILVALPLFVLWVWPLAIISAFVGSVFRDFQQLIIIMLQAVWYISPVFFQPQMFYTAGLRFLVDDNPIYYLMSLIRLPLLEGKWPTEKGLILVLGSILVFWMISAFIICKKESKIILYL